MSRANCARSENGLIHVVSVINPEHTLCGDAFDIGDTEGDAPGGSWKLCESQPITCPECSRVVMSCRGLKVKGGE